MPILTPAESSDLLNYSSVEEMPPKVQSIFLPAVDEFLKTATGKAWGVITETYPAIDPIAKMAAGILLVRWFEDDSEMGKASGIGILGLIGQLSAKYQQEKQAET